jgi:hypothetical protein
VGMGVEPLIAWGDRARSQRSQVFRFRQTN